MYPDEHGEDYEYHEKRGRKDHLTSKFNKVLKEKISNEKLFKKMKHQFREYQEEHVNKENHIDIDKHINIVVSMRNDRIEKERHFRSKVNDIVGQIILNIIAISHKEHLRNFVSLELCEYSKQLEKEFEHTESSYVHKLMSMGYDLKNNPSRFKAAKHMVESRYTEEKISALISKASDAITQIEYRLNNTDDKRIAKKANSFKQNLQRLIEQYNDMSYKRNSI